MGGKIAWSGLGLLFGVSHFIPEVVTAGAIVLIIGVVLLVLDK